MKVVLRWLVRAAQVLLVLLLVVLPVPVPLSWMRTPEPRGRTPAVDVLRKR